MSGGKGGSQSTSVKIPKWLEDAAKSNLARADEVAKIGYTPYYGPDVAALTPMQQAAMQGTNDAAAAFGMAAPAIGVTGYPPPQTFAGGVQGYSAAPMFQQSVDQLAAQRPAQYAALNAPFINPITGAQPLTPFNTAQPAPAAGGSTGLMPIWNGRGEGAGGAGFQTPSGASGPAFERTGRDPANAGRYTSLADMFNGGGAGASGSTFQGGPLSGTLNTLGVRPAGSGGSSSGMGGGK